MSSEKSLSKERCVDSLSLGLVALRAEELTKERKRKRNFVRAKTTERASERTSDDAEKEQLKALESEKSFPSRTPVCPVCAEIFI